VIGVTRWPYLEQTRREGTLSAGSPPGEDGAMTDSLRAGLREVVAARATLDLLEARLVIHARRNGCTWAELGQDLQLTAAGARRRHLAVDPVFAVRPLKPPSIDEYHAEFVAAMRAQGISLK